MGWHAGKKDKNISKGLKIFKVLFREKQIRSRAQRSGAGNRKTVLNLASAADYDYDYE